jgi:hypothetical protein
MLSGMGKPPSSQGGGNFTKEDLREISGFIKSSETSNARSASYFGNGDPSGGAEGSGNAQGGENTNTGGKTAAAFTSAAMVLVVTPEPVTTVTGFLILGGVAATTATISYLNNNPFPKPWFTERPNNYIPSSPQGSNNRDYFPNGNGNDFIKWMIRFGGAATLGKKLYEGFNPEPYVAPQDNTRVQPPFYTPIPNPNYDY